MSFKFDQKSGRLAAAEEAVGSGVRKGAAGTPEIIPAYKASTGSNVGVLNVMNRVKGFQEIFKLSGHGDTPVFLRGPRDQLIYRGAMLFSLVGISFALYGIFRMSTGKIQSKRSN